MLFLQCKSQASGTSIKNEHFKLKFLKTIKPIFPNPVTVNDSDDAKETSYIVCGNIFSGGEKTKKIICKMVY